MSIGETLNKNVMSFVTLAITIVIGSVVLVKFKYIDGVTAALNTTIDTFVTAIGEPQNWVAIVIIALVGYAVLKIFTGKKNM